MQQQTYIINKPRKSIMNPDNYPYFMVLKDKGNQYFQKKDYLKSIQYYTQSINKNPCYLQAYSNRALAYFHLKEYSLSLQDSQLILRDNPKHVKTLIRKAFCIIQFLYIDQGLNLLHEAEQLERLKRYVTHIEDTKKLQFQVESFLKHHKKNAYREASQNIKNLKKQIDGTSELQFYYVDCCIHLYSKQTIQSFFKDMIDSKFQRSFLYWYLKAKFDLIHCNKSKAIRYIYQSLRLINRMQANEPISKLMAYFKNEVHNLCKEINDLQLFKIDRQNLFKHQKYRECIEKCSQILKFNFLNVQEKVKAYQKRALSYKALKEHPKRYNDIITILKIEINSPTGLELRCKFFLDQYKYKEARKDLSRLKQIDPNKAKQIQQEIENQLLKHNRIKYKTYYAVLCVQPFSSEKQIRKSYKELAVVYHPDKNAYLQPQVIQYAADRWADIQKVYGILTNTEQRTIYDRSGREEKEIIDQKLQQMRKQFLTLFKSKNIQMPPDEKVNPQQQKKKLKEKQKALQNLSQKEKKKQLKIIKKQIKQIQKKQKQKKQQMQLYQKMPQSQRIQQEFTKTMIEVNQNLKKGNFQPYIHAMHHFRLNPLSAQRMASLPVFSALNTKNRMPTNFNNNFMGLKK